MSQHSPLVRFLMLLVGTSAALRLAWWLIEPLLPVLAAVLGLVAVWQLVRWYRGRW